MPKEIHYSYREWSTNFSGALSSYAYKKPDVEEFARMYGYEDIPPNSEAAEILVGLSEDVLNFSKMNGRAIEWLQGPHRTRREAARLVFEEHIGPATVVEKFKKGRKQR